METNERIAQLKWKTLLVYLRGLKRLIRLENLDEWILEVIDVIENNSWEKAPENSVLLALFELWFQLKWYNFDLEEKLILLDGLEAIIPSKQDGAWLNVIIDDLREYAKESITTNLRLQSSREDYERRRP